jgi:hypothetical protein
MGPRVRGDDNGVAFVSTGRTFAFPRHKAPEVCVQLRPKEGAGNAGRLVRPQPRVVGNKHAR